MLNIFQILHLVILDKAKYYLKCCNSGGLCWFWLVGFDVLVGWLLFVLGVLLWAHFVGGVFAVRILCVCVIILSSLRRAVGIEYNL